MRQFTFFMLFLVMGPAMADANRQTKGEFYDAFRQLDVDLPTPNSYRTASGAPGHGYWQQRVDYDIEVSLDEQARSITGSETVRYANRSPDPLRYLWFQLDQNRFQADSLEQRSQAAPDPFWFPDSESQDILTFGGLGRLQSIAADAYGHRIQAVSDSTGKPVPHVINGTMMRVDLPQPLAPGEDVELNISWSFNIVNEARVGSRGGYEHFPENDTYIYFLAQWFPRLAAYTDYAGWQNHQFIGRGEFTLEFGNYNVSITVPSDHIVSATGVLKNPDAVLTKAQRDRLAKARKADKPLFIVTPEEAAANETERATGTKTWVFEAENVRDFAWSSSRKYIWGRHDPQTGGPGGARGACHVVLSEGGGADLVEVLHRSRGAYHGGLFPFLVPLSLSNRAISEYVEVRGHGVPDDHVQWLSAGALRASRGRGRQVRRRGCSGKCQG